MKRVLKFQDCAFKHFDDFKKYIIFDDFFFFNVDPPEALYGEFVFVEAAKTMTHQLKPQLHIISTELAPAVTAK